jgi:hypothetical protein
VGPRGRRTRTQRIAAVLGAVALTVAACWVAALARSPISLRRASPRKAKHGSGFRVSGRRRHRWIPTGFQYEDSGDQVIHTRRPGFAWRTLVLAPYDETDHWFLHHSSKRTSGRRTRSLGLTAGDGTGRPVFLPTEMM